MSAFGVPGTHLLECLGVKWPHASVPMPVPVMSPSQSSVIPKLFQCHCLQVLATLYVFVFPLLSQRKGSVMESDLHFAHCTQQLILEVVPYQFRVQLMSGSPTHMMQENTASWSLGRGCQHLAVGSTSQPSFEKCGSTLDQNGCRTAKPPQMVFLCDVH